ncbi:hypothetical protein GCM10023115_34190 [Pontixanthobacter gangjinensis]
MLILHRMKKVHPSLINSKVVVAARHVIQEMGMVAVMDKVFHRLLVYVFP